jgi:hypothetical protein
LGELVIQSMCAVMLEPVALLFINSFRWNVIHFFGIK